VTELFADLFHVRWHVAIVEGNPGIHVAFLIDDLAALLELVAGRRL
jgi:hypothetical protein